MTVSLRQTAFEHLNEFAPGGLTEPDPRQAHPPLLERERSGDDLGKRRALPPQASHGA